MKPRSILATLVILLLLSLGLGSSPMLAQCGRWIVEHVPVVHRHHSKAALASWAAWNAKHGAPKPRKEVLRRYDIACGVVEEVPVTLEAVVQRLQVPQFEAPEVDSTPAIDFTGDLIAKVPQMYAPIQYTPFMPVWFGGGYGGGIAPAQTPEPSTIYMALAGLLGVGIVRKVRA